MQLTPRLTPDLLLPESLPKLAYQTLQWGKNYFGVAHRTLSTRLYFLLFSPQFSQIQPVGPEVLEKLQQRYDRLIEVDWQDAEAGVYPHNLLFDHPWDEFFQYYPVVLLDMPRIWERAGQKRHKDFAADIDTAGYPSYYLRNFHYQTDGYLSDSSANLYDLQVELLFGGTADPMRRRVLAPLKQRLTAFADLPPCQIRILDVACGTGRTLKQLRAAFPQAALFGTDLSSAYLRKANQLLCQNPGELPQLLQANAESLPYLDNYFHGITCVFTFHELPGPVRQRVIEECFRVIQPGGTFVICDSIQMQDSPELMPMMENFPAIYHEPFYPDYIQDDLEARLETAGFTDIQTEVHLVSHYWIARKPA